MSVVESFWFVPVMNCLLAGCVVAVCLFLFFSIKGEVQRLANTCVNAERFLAEVKTITQGVEAIGGRVKELERDKALYPDLGSHRAAVSAGNQRHVLRLYQRGESAAEIASALNLPAGEVQLRIKVYELTQNIPGAGRVEKSL